MLTPSQTLSLTIEKPAVGGWMIARQDGLIVLVDGAIPGERVTARIDSVGKGVAYAETLGVDVPSPDRRLPFTDRKCGGCLYAHIAYPRQLEIKSQIIADVFARIGRLALSAPVPVAASPEAAYRMRARLHRRGPSIGFFRVRTHDVCGVRATRQLLPATCDVIDRLAIALADLPSEAVREIELSENLDASERVIHLQPPPGASGPGPHELSPIEGITGITTTAPACAARVLAGSAYVSDALAFPGHAPLTIRRHVLSFFQGNRYLLVDLVAHVTRQIPRGSEIIDLYAGGGLFAVAAARLCESRVTAVEGESLAADDLVLNAQATGGAVEPVSQSVEAFVASCKPGAEVVLVDPPRTGLSKAALRGVMGLGGRRIVYVSCDIATLARDTRRLLDAGYDVARVDGFDLFPNTPHVETVVVFDKG
jgi:23S rRNA (uracil1939-C5)-methyltransferase